MTPRLPLLPAPVRWAGVAAVATLILAASVTRPTGAAGTLGPLGLVGLDAYLHAAAYATLALALGYALADSRVERVAVVVAIAALGFGVGVELLQSALPYRTPSLSDVLANAVGAVAVALLWRALLRRVRLRPVGP
ncbi:MAG: VanZ family protein [Halorientalis sp.]